MNILRVIAALMLSAVAVAAAAGLLKALEGLAADAIR